MEAFKVYIIKNQRLNQLEATKATNKTGYDS